ncbi:MAG: glycoside hydrolase family 92 protein, partial [Cyclobacteriaceae bacterium]|nr:glycoside hydrolase family 92 protein [Cyclobacteriaceae bacterium HetDA_MAG_MS6]
NDDCGTISCWLVLSMMGIYPDLPGKPQYALSTPLFDQVTISLDPNFYQGKEIVIQHQSSATTPDRKTRPVNWNGTPLESRFLEHSELTKGGTLVFE